MKLNKTILSETMKEYISGIVFASVTIFGAYAAIWLVAIVTGNY